MDVAEQQLHCIVACPQAVAVSLTGIRIKFLHKAVANDATYNQNEWGKKGRIWYRWPVKVQVIALCLK